MAIQRLKKVSLKTSSLIREPVMQYRKDIAQKALKADLCEIYTDVEGVFTTDPRLCPDAVKLDRISYEEMLELAGVGAKVLQIRSVECASRYKVRVHVRSSFDDSEGTWVVPEEKTMEDVLVSGVAYERDQAKVTVVGVPDTPGG